jgi:ubiquinone/menaquinone biosynthesis C-methylase UbiE
MGGMIMDSFELYNIAEIDMEMINPFSSEKIIKIGKVLGLKQGQRIMDFGCGFGELLVLWTKTFGISGIGVDIRQHACNRALKKIEDLGLSDSIEIVCGNGAEYEFEKNGYDVATCIGASFIWGDFKLTVKAMKEAIHPKGKLVIGEPYWLTEPVPKEYKEENQEVLSEYELLKFTREEGFDIQYMLRASHEDWDWYETSNWLGLTKWLEKNPDHPEVKEVIDWFYKIQNDYFKYGREYLGFAVYVLNPIKYK